MRDIRSKVRPHKQRMGKNVTSNVYTYRENAGFTQEELAEKVGVTRQTIIALEKGNYTPKVTLALKLAKVLKVKVEDLFKIV